MKKISLLGATGSVGLQTVDVIQHHPEAFRLVAMAFGENVDKGLEIIKLLKPKLVSVKNDQVAKQLQRHLSGNVKVVSGLEGLIEVAAYHEADIVLNAVLGSIGLEPTLAAIEAGKTIALSNKETLVTAGHLVMEAAEKNHVKILPVDSEHSAIFQALNGEKLADVRRLILTASGGSFRDKSRSELQNVTIEDALNHPNWSMGAKLTVDSATMMNKGLEVIEAHWLFGLSYDDIDVLIHKESIVHSLVEYNDSSVIAQLGDPDMRVPIQYALTFPDRLELHGAKRLNLWEVGQLHFSQVDFQRFICLKLAYDAGRTGGTMTTVLNAANEEAVSAFLKGKIAFLDIETIVTKAMEAHQPIHHPSLDDIRGVDKDIRHWVRSEGLKIK
ncbi:1-deoxy-D-xylulose-5-phosphate reductoisomerase [Pullulanibacillus pueri]|uniref:1-deoxy-D-xylulose 5-phosphate reductoisomerase n=1 Tax=Pullulanibacillus pueri TaxID=1437324 RepID=A0A8J2ZWT6_9BACL|nr:1-deoxy-D-xylulose-5-phosphate reductoisomerase [Pullulanibacillus pueri]MBM7682510.1 1-deoxy-D-xylulose-5-phosphate reductoisomerase [Pullulanibacillus pueri]GGH82110.1 1-deoxy-D-xylulose 5-phosphate reductoisomerase 2 [Pullulanibacillus pueri]